MKTKTSLFAIISIFALGLHAQSAPAAAPAPANATTPAAAATAAAPVAAPLTVDINLTDMMSFSVTKIEAHPGQTLTVRLKNNGTLPKEIMGHNWILLKADADWKAYAMAAAGAKDENFQPKALAGQVIASIPMIGAKESGQVTFTCPTAPGNYTYLCSCYGHSMAGMKGTLIVK
jgi:azurin